MPHVDKKNSNPVIYDFDYFLKLYTRTLYSFMLFYA